MTYQANVYKVLIASPSDVAEEREIVREVLNEWNAVHSEKHGIVLLPVGWETHASPEMGDHPQVLINKQLASDCDLLVGVFWTRAGTPTNKYLSGSIEEIEEHIAAGKLAMLYFSSAPLAPGALDPEQYQKLLNFQKSCRTRGLFESYSNIDDFKNKLYRHIQLKINNHEFFKTKDRAKGNAESAEPSLLPSKLTEEAANLLRHAAGDAGGAIMRIRHLGGTMIQAGSANFDDNQDARITARLEGALEDLEKLGFVKAANTERTMFRVTRDGYKATEASAFNGARDTRIMIVFVEPQPKGNQGRVNGYKLEDKDNKSVTSTTYQTQAEAIAAAKGLGHKPLVARVRDTNKGNPDHWREA